MNRLVPVFCGIALGVGLLAYVAIGEWLDHALQISIGGAR